MPREDPRSGYAPGGSNKRRADGCHGVKMLRDHQVDRRRGGLGSHEPRTPQISTQEQVIRTPRRDRNANAVPVDLLHPVQ